MISTVWLIWIWRINWWWENANIIVNKLVTFSLETGFIKYEWLTIINHTEPPPRQYRGHRVFIFGPQCLYETIWKKSMGILNGGKKNRNRGMREWHHDFSALLLCTLKRWVLYGSEWLTEIKWNGKFEN